MTKRSVKFKLLFQTARYVSAYEVPDKIRITFYDRYMFVSNQELAIVGQKYADAPWNTRRRLQDEDQFLYLEREIPT